MQSIQKMLVCLWCAVVDGYFRLLALETMADDDDDVGSVVGSSMWSTDDGDNPRNLDGDDVW